MESLSAGQEVVDEEDSVGRGKHGLGDDGGVIGSVGEGVNAGGVDLTRHVVALGLLGKDHGHVKGQGAKAGQTNTRRLDGEDLVHALVLEQAVELLAQLTNEAGVQLLVQKGADLQYVAVLNDTVLTNAILHELHGKTSRSPTVFSAVARH